MRKASLQACVTFFIVLCACFTVNTMANDEINFSEMDHEIYLKPWVSYQKLIGMQAAAQSYDQKKYLWWLMRKAQAENFVYFYDDFNNTIKQAVGLITEKIPLSIQSRLYVLQGISHRRQGHYTLSEQSLAKALSQAKKAKLRRVYIHAKHELASTKALTKFYQTSLAELQEAYVEAFTLSDQFLMASINEVYGVIYSYLDKYEKSIEYYKRALETYKYLQYPAHIARTTGGIASTYRYWKKYDLAVKYFKQYRQNIDYTPHANVNFFAAYGLAMTYAEKGDCELAITAIDKVLNLKGLVHYDAELYKRKSSCLISLNRLDEAEEALFNAANNFSNLPDLMGTSWQLEMLKISGELTHARGNYDLGYKMLEQYYQKYTKLLLANTSNELEKVKNEVETQRQELTQTLEKKRLQLDLLELDKHNIVNSQKLYYSILVFCMLLIVSAVVILQFRNNKKIYKLTIKDPLSNLFNRRYVFDFLDSLIPDATPNKTELSVILIDIDNLKKVNDNFGYPIGDKVICQMATIGKQVFRHGDVFSRVGGEEFLCVLPRTNISEAEKVAQRFLDIVNQSELVPDPKYKVTVSIGIAAVSCQDDNASQLFANADIALHRAKHLGNNQVNIFK